MSLVLPDAFGLSDDQRRRAKMVGDRLLRDSKELCGGDVRLFVIGALNAMGYAIARSELFEDKQFISNVVTSVPLYINAYKQDGPGERFSKDS